MSGIAEAVCHKSIHKPDLNIQISKIIFKEERCSVDAQLVLLHSCRRLDTLSNTSSLMASRTS